MINTILENDNVVGTILEDEELVEIISSNEDTVAEILSDDLLVDTLLSDTEIVEEIKLDLLTDYYSEIEDTLGENAEKIATTIQNLDSDGIEIRSNIETDEYVSEIIINSTLDGNDISISYSLDLVDEIETAIYDVKIIENSDDQFEAVLKDRNTGEEITISENDAHASSTLKLVARVDGAGSLKYFSAKTGQSVSASAAKNASKSFSSGKAGEKFIESKYKYNNIGFQVSRRVNYKKSERNGELRIIDVLDKSKIAHEAKVGRVSKSTFVKKQVEKDWALIKSGQIKGATWHFLRSSNTGLRGPTKPLEQYLKDHGITIVYWY